MTTLEAIWTWLSLSIIGKITWNSLRALFNGGIYWDLTEAEQDTLRKLLVKEHYIILIRRKTHLTTYLIALGSWLKTGKWSYWSHALMNLEGDDAQSDDDFCLEEATGTGVHYSTFMQVFDCDSVVLLRPRALTSEDWADALYTLKDSLGKPYDTLFDLTEDRRLSCVELVYASLKKHLDKFPAFKDAVKKYGTLTPQMFYDCPDFDRVLEIRH